jgi:hypothetical protein
MRTIGNWPAMLIGVALLATAGATACSANLTPSSAGPSDRQTTKPAATAAASQSTGGPSVTPTGPVAVQDLVITSAGKTGLTTAFVTFKGISSDEVASGGPVPGSVYYAYDPATDTYWAAASFLPVNTLTLSALEAFQQGGDIAMYQKAGDGSWQVQTGASSLTCLAPNFFPQAVLVAWSLPTVPACTD